MASYLSQMAGFKTSLFPHFFFKICIVFSHVSVYVHVRPGALRDQRFRSPRGAVTRGCEGPELGLGTELRSQQQAFSTAELQQ